jgi:hypothetical protein
MRKTLFTLLAILTMTTATAQTKGNYEPEFIGETNLLCINDKDTTSFAAEKQIGVVKAKVCIPADTRSPIPVIPVHSVGNLQYMWQS